MFHMKFGIIVFPGSNCDHDSYHAAITATGQQAAMLWHDSHDLENCDAIIVPGGFAYGDYLRTGAIARFAPIMQEVGKFAASGGLVIGICNGSFAAFPPSHNAWPSWYERDCKSIKEGFRHELRHGTHLLRRR